MHKKYSIFITVLFCVFIFGLGGWLLWDMAHPKDFSEQENRWLEQMPELKIGRFELPGMLNGTAGGNFFNGAFMEDFEDFVVDQFPMRDGWIHLKAQSERLLGKRENNSVYLGRDSQTLFAFFTPAAGEDLKTRVGYVNSLADHIDAPVYFSLVPDKSYVWADLLPANAPNVDDGSMNAAVGALAGDGVNYIDLYGALSGDDAFYRTDHHWTTMGAYQGYTALAEGMNGSATLMDGEPTKVSDDFYGTTWSSAGAGWVGPDSIYTWVPEGGLNGRVTVTRYPEGSPVEGSLYDLSKLEVKDKYSMFLGGNQPLCILRNPDGQNGKLLVVRDSYSDSLAPFLALDYGEVHLWDLRYNNMSLKQYAADNGIDQVLVLYSASNFTSDANLFKLGL